MPGDADCMCPQTTLGKSVSYLLKIRSYSCITQNVVQISASDGLFIRNAEFQAPPQTYCIKTRILMEALGGLYALAPFFQRAQCPIQPPEEGNTKVREGRLYRGH